MRELGDDPQSGTVYIRVAIPELKIQKCLQFQLDDSVWQAKQRILSAFAKDLRDPLNYGLYLPPTGGRAGKFLDEERLLKEYPLQGPIGFLEFKYKKRVYKVMQINPRKLRQLHTKANLKHVMEYVRGGQVDKINKLTNKGLDSNFHDQDSGETPLSVAVTLPREKCRNTVMALVSGGAHLDFRNKQGLTALHRAAILGNTEAVKTLLDLGASPDYKDGRGLTPLYYSVSSDADPACTEMLLHERAMVGTQDEQGSQEVHQACRFGHVQHLEHLLYYGADMDVQNNSGNTPLHVCAANNQESCLRVLLFRGANKETLNYSNQTAYQVAIIAGNSELAEVIKNFKPEDVVPFREIPKYSTRRKTTGVSNTLRNLVRSRSDPRLNLSLLEEQFGGPGSASSSTCPSIAHGPFHSSDTLENGSYPPSNEYNSDSPRSLSISSTSSGPVLTMADQGYWEGRCEGREGWFPSNAVQEVRLRKAGSMGDLLGDSETVTMNRNTLAALIHTDSEFSPRTVVLHKSPEGYGFVLRGAKSPGKAGQQPLLFQPTPEFPALQYLDSVDPGSQADAVGLKSGDFILEINGENVVQASHERVVHIIRSAQASLVLKVVTVRPTERSADWFMHQDGSMTLPSRKKQAPAPPKRDPHTSLSQSKATSRSMVEGLAEIGAIETLDQTLAEFEKSEYHRRHSLHNAASEEQKVASVRSTHSAKRMSCVELDNLMTGDHGARPHTAGGSPRGAREYMSPSELRIKKYHKKQGSGGMERSKSTPDLAADPESGGGGPPEVIYMGATVQQGRGAAGHNAATWSKAHAVGGGATPREPIYMQTGIAGEVRRPAAYLDPRAVQAGVYAGTMPRAGRGPREPVPVPVPVPPPQQDALGVPALPGRAPVPKRPAPPPPTASHEVVRVQPRPETTYANVSEEIQLRKKQESPYESSFRPGTSARLSTQPLVTTAALEQAMLKHRKTHSNGSAASQGQEAGAKAEGDKPSVTFAEDKVYESAASFLQKHPNATLLVTADVHAGDGRGGRGKTYYEPEPDYDTEDRHDSVSLSSSTAAQASLPTSRRSSSTLSTGSGCRVEVGGQDTPPLQQHHFQEASPSAAPSSSVTVIAIGGQRESPQMRRSSPQMRRESPLMARQSHYASLQEREAGPGAQSQRYTIHSDIPSSKPPSSSTPAPGVGVSVTSAGSSKMFIPPRPPEPAPKPPSASTSRRSSIQSNQSSGDREHPPEPPVTHTEPPTHAPPPPPPPPPPPMMAPLRTSASAGTLIEKRPPAGVVDSSGPGSMIPTQDILAAVAQRKARMETDGPRMSAAPAPAAKPAAKTQIELNQEALKKAVARRKDMLENADNVSIVESIEGRLMRTKKLQSGKYFFSSDTIARDKRKSEDLDKGKAGEPAADQGKDVSPTQTPAPSKSPASGQPEKPAYSALNNTAPTPAPPPVLDVKLKPLNAGPTSQPKPIFEMSSKPPATPAPAPGVSKVTVNATKTAPPPPPQKSSASPGNASPPTKPAEMKPPSPKPPAPVPPAGDGKKAVAPPPPTSPTSHGKVAPPPPPPQTAAEKKQSDFLALAAKAREEWLQKKGASGSPSHGGEDAHTLPRPAKASATITVGDSPPRGGEEEDPSKTSIRSRIANFEKGKGSLNGALSRSGNNLELGGVTEDDSYTDYTLRRGQNRNSATGNGVADYVAPPPGFGDVDSGSHPGGKVHIDIIPPPASFGGSGSTGGSSPGTEGAFGHDDAASLVSSVSTLSELSSEQGEGRSGHHHEEIFAPPPPGFDDHGEDCQDMPPPPQFGGDGPGSRRGAVRPFQAKAVEAWLCTDVLDWLDSLGMGHYKDNFARNCIDGPKLAGLGRNDYIELGVTQVGHRMNLERSIKKLVVQKAGQV